MTEHISGTFDVTMGPQAMHEAAANTGIGRMSLDKRYHGDLDATGTGEMLAVMTSTPGSAGYVALEKVEGTLSGREGSFVLQHTGTMNRGAPSLSVTVVPDSGRGRLVGLSGTLAIRIEGDKHFYDFDYSLRDSSAPVMTARTAGYSGTPLSKKLGIAVGSRVVLVSAPADYRVLLEPLPDDVTFVDVIDASCDLVHLFTTGRNTLEATLKTCREQLGPDGVVWASWPKKASKVATDVTEDVIRAVALPLGFVDVKVCAVDATWSGLKLVVRQSLR